MRAISRKSEPDTNTWIDLGLPVPCRSLKKHEKTSLMRSRNYEAPSALPRSRVSGWTTVAMSAVYWRLERLPELQHHRGSEREREREGERERERERERLGVVWRRINLPPSSQYLITWDCLQKESSFTNTKASIYIYCT